MKSNVLYYDDQTGNGNWYIEGNKVKITSKKLMPYSVYKLVEVIDTAAIPFASVRDIYTKKFDWVRTAFLFIGIGIGVLAIFMIGLAASNSKTGFL